MRVRNDIIKKKVAQPQVKLLSGSGMNLCNSYMIHRIHIG